MNSDREKYKAYALSVSEKWSLEEVRSAFAAEYADRRVHDDERIKLWGGTFTLRGKIGALRKKIKKLENNIAKARAIPLRNCDRFDNEEDAFNEWSTTIGRNYKFGQGGYGMAWAFTKWLFTEAKGGAQ